MKPFALLLLTMTLMVSAAPSARAQTVVRDVVYGTDDKAKQNLDIYTPANAKNAPVLFWIHGGGWQVGDKSEVQKKPEWFVQRGYVFVSINYRLLPAVEMEALTRDVAKAFKWVQDHIAEHGGNPKHVVVGGHSAGAQLAALICTDDRWLKAEGVSFDVLKGCIPVDGDTYDIPAIIELAETRWRTHGLTPSKYGHRVKFGNDPAKHKDFSAVTHVAKGKGIPPFLIVYVSSHPDTSAQAHRLANVLKEAGVAVKAYGAKDSEHSKVSENIGLPDDPTTAAIAEFLK
jgi:acetyl esterase/lipase